MGERLLGARARRARRSTGTIGDGEDLIRRARRRRRCGRRKERLKGERQDVRRDETDDGAEVSSRSTSVCAGCMVILDRGAVRRASGRDQLETGFSVRVGMGMGMGVTRERRFPELGAPACGCRQPGDAAVVIVPMVRAMGGNVQARREDERDREPQERGAPEKGATADRSKESTAAMMATGVAGTGRVHGSRPAPYYAGRSASHGSHGHFPTPSRTGRPGGELARRR